MVNPHESEQFRETESNFQRIPRHVVDAVILNDVLLENTSDKSLRMYRDQEYLLDQTAFMAFGNSELGTPKTQTSTMGRAFLVEKGNYRDEIGVHHGMIFAKGTGVGKAQSTGAHITHPKGFFGELHSLQDQYLSNAYAHLGGRTARVIGTITLDPSKLVEWICSQESTGYHPQYELSKLLANGDYPSILVRIFEGARDTEVLDSQSYRFKNQQMYGIPNLAHAFKILASEVESRGKEAFQHQYGLSDAKIDEISSHSLDSKRDLNSYFKSYNLGVLKAMNTIIPEVRISNHGSNYGALGMYVDWENGLEESGQYSEYVPRDSTKRKQARAYAIGKARAMEASRSLEL